MTGELRERYGKSKPTDHDGCTPRELPTYRQAARRCTNNGWSIKEQVRMSGMLVLNVLTPRGPKTIKTRG